MVCAIPTALSQLAVAVKQSVVRAPRSASVALALALLLAPNAVRAQALGEVGESCQKRGDCGPNLRCIEHRCTASGDKPACSSAADCSWGATCQDGVCVAAPPEPAPAEDTQGATWSEFSLEGNHPFVGLTIGPGASGFWLYTPRTVDVNAAFLFAIRGGALLDRAEIAMELAPVTWVPDFSADPNFSFLVSVGGLPRIGEQVYWPLRFGVGLSAVNTPGGDVLAQGRLDLIGVAFQYGHLLFEVSLPSTRFHTEFEVYGIWGWLCNVSVSYVMI